MLNIKTNPLGMVASFYEAANLCPCWPNAQSQVPHF
jgi:hypothetical protein